MSIIGYNVRKAAQVVFFFAKKEGGQIPVLKLVKLLYLADRESLEKYDYPILFDQMVSMTHGPVVSNTLDYINGCVENRAWDEFVSDKNNHNVGVSNSRISISDLDELSEAEIEILENTWSLFGKLNKYQIRDYTHTNCPEWEDPKGSSYAIPYERIFKFLGKKNSAALSDGIQDIRELYSI